MLRLVLIFSFAVAVSGAGFPFFSSTIEERIIGGENASIQEAPYQASIIYGIGDIVDYLTCGGVIISANIVLTAGHCYYDEPIAYRVRVGTDESDLDSGLKINVSRIIRHENYTTLGFENDIAIFFLVSDLDFDGVTIAPISLPAQGEEVAEGTLAISTGFGTYTPVGPYPVMLQKIIIPIYNQSACVENYAPVNWIIYDYNICAGLEDGGMDACRGDDGGPLVVGSTLVGIHSFGKCAASGFPGVWIRVASFVDWIKENTGL